MKFTKASAPLKGTVSIPGDKSISHRSVMFGALADGTTKVTNFLRGADCLSTIACFRKLGIEIEETPDEILICGKGIHGLTAPGSMLDVGNSGTTTRLISGILAGQPFTTELNGDESIQSRPMKRIIDPLSQMGADIESIRGNGCATASHSPKSAPRHSLSIQSCFCSGQILYPAGRSLCRRHYQCDRTLSFPQSHRDHAEAFRSTNHQ